MEKIYYISVSGDWGDCMVSWDNEPTWCADNAMTFKSNNDAQKFIDEHGKEWVGVNKMIICEM